jgi:hypothetical protein
MTKHRETTDEELELIEMRYRQALALMSLEDLFAEGQLDCMRGPAAVPPAVSLSLAGQSG